LRRNQWRGFIGFESKNRSSGSDDMLGLRAGRRRACRSSSSAPVWQSAIGARAARPEIQEVDLNPVTVYAVGQGALSLDALIVINAPDGRTTSGPDLPLL
jgi:hypothetical protein